MRKMVLISVALLATPAIAQQRTTTLPEIIVGGSTPTQLSQERCVEVEIGSSRAFNCLNQRLKREVDRVNPSMNIPPVDARSADIRVGVVNMPAVQQQYGRNFGVSVVPYRPAPPVFTSPIGRR